MRGQYCVMTAVRPILRQPDITRSRLLDCAYAEIHQRGFRSASLDSILEKAGVTKGALYHHFDNKAALGYAVVDEIIRPFMQGFWLPLADAEDPIATAISGIKKRREKLKQHLLAYGCPFNNLAQEMSPIDEGFRTRLQGILDEWRHTLAAALQRGGHLHHLRAGRADRHGQGSAEQQPLRTGPARLD